MHLYSVLAEGHFSSEMAQVRTCDDPERSQQPDPFMQGMGELVHRFGRYVVLSH